MTSVRFPLRGCMSPAPALVGAVILASCARPTADHEPMRAEVARLTQSIQELEAELAKRCAKIDALTKLAEKPKPTALGRRAPFFSLEVRGASNESIIKSMALQVGNRWVYDYTYKSTIGGTGKIITVTWERHVSVVAHRRAPQGLVVLRAEAVHGTKYDYPVEVGEKAVSWFKTNPPGVVTTHYLIDNGYVYGIDEGRWDDEKRKLTTECREWLRGACPEFFFPVSDGLNWSDRKREERDYLAGLLFKVGKAGRPNSFFFYWKVGGQTSVDLPITGARPATPITWHDNTGHTVRWVREGMGVVRETYSHHGSYIESEMTLKEFHGARSIVPALPPLTSGVPR